MHESTEPARSAKSRIPTHVASLEELLGAHPDAIESLFLRSDPADPADLGEAPRGLVLAVSGFAPVHLATRGVVRFAAQRLVPWSGVVFDHGGCAGANRVFGREVARFRAERAASLLDGGAALILSYDAESKLLAGLRDELRRIGPGIALGATFVRGQLAGWFGLTKLA